MKIILTRALLLLSVVFPLLLGGCGETTSRDQLLNPKQQQPTHNVTLYVHGFDREGYQQAGVYGESSEDSSIQLLSELVSSQPFSADVINIFKTTQYYGDTPPTYYNESDVNDIEAVTRQWGGGIPRYAAIVAKHIRYLLESESVNQVNIVSGSMGSLVTRWLIEKNVGGLAEEKRIARWFSIEGVIRGNYAAGKRDALRYFYKDINSIDIRHMDPAWVENNLHSPAGTASSIYYKDILVGHQGSTKDDLNHGALTTFMRLNGQYAPNDGTQKLTDTYFSDVTENARYQGRTPPLTLIHANHLSVAKHSGALASVATFLGSTRRIRISLIEAKVSNIRERIKWYNRSAEVIFGSKVYSPSSESLWSIDRAISERTRSGGTLSVHKYRKNGETRYFNETIFDQLVLPNETSLRIQLTVEEIDSSLKYNVYEAVDDSFDLIDQTEILVPVENGVYQFSDNEISVSFEVEVFDYSPS